MNEEPSMLFWLAIVTLVAVVVIALVSYLRTRRAQQTHEHSAMGAKHLPANEHGEVPREPGTRPNLR